ncbi:AarF/UbiB family protein [Isosphaeraceae bacterium EP7]
MIRETVGHLRDLPRYSQILATLVRYGYHDVVVALRLERLIGPIERVAMGEGVPPPERAIRLRMVCEDLGPTFVKLGQVLSTRADLLPEAYTTELARLRDDVRPFPFAEAEAILAEEYGKPLAEVFAAVDPEPIASASVSQVYRATTFDGRTLALKVRRPNIDKIIQADLDILRNLAALADRHLAFMAPYAPIELAREFERSLRRELDFTVERRTMERCRQQFEGDSTAHIPETYAEYSTGRVLAMEFIEGVSPADAEALARLGLDPAKVACTGARILLEMIFRHGFFHADPHPGNLRVLPGGVIAPLDFGMFGHLDSPTRERIADVLHALMTQDVDRLIRALDGLDIRPESTDTRALHRELAELVSAYSDLTLDAIDLSHLLHDLFALVRVHRLKIPPDLVLLIRSLVTIEGVGRRLDPHFDIGAQLLPLLRHLILRRFSPWRLLTRSIRTAEDFQRIATLLPEVLGQSLESIRRGELTVKFDLQHFEDLVRQLIRAGNVLAASVVIAGLIIGSALVLRAGVGPAMVSYTGYGVAFLLGLWLIWYMFRK